MSTDALESSCTAQSRRGLRRFVIAAIRSEPVLTRNTGNIMDETVTAAGRPHLRRLNGKSEQRVAMRVSQGGHDVPTEKLIARFPRTLANLSAAIRELRCVLVFDND